MPTMYLMVGLPGSGKTHRARELAAEHAAVRLTPDEWAISIFGNGDRHQSRPDGMRWMLEGRLVALALDLLGKGVSVVLDFGLWSRDERSALRWLAQSVGAQSQVVHLPAERDLQWARIRERLARDPDHNFPMDESERDAWLAGFEEPDAEELAEEAVPPPPEGDGSWFDWACRFWPSLAGSLDGRPA